jgi:flagellar hook-associated protein 2
MATQMNNTLTTMLSTSTGSAGVIQNAKDGINKTLKTLGERYDAMEAKLMPPWRVTKPSSPVWTY